MSFRVLPDERIYHGEPPSASVMSNVRDRQDWLSWQPIDPTGLSGVTDQGTPTEVFSFDLFVPSTCIDLLTERCRLVLSLLLFGNVNDGSAYVQVGADIVETDGGLIVALHPDGVQRVATLDFLADSGEGLYTVQVLGEVSPAGSNFMTIEHQTRQRGSMDDPFPRGASWITNPFVGYHTDQPRSVP